MNRFFSYFLSLAMCASLGSVATASSMATKHMMSKHMSCAKGQMYVHGYMKNGKFVKGYCRKKHL